MPARQFGAALLCPGEGDDGFLAQEPMCVLLLNIDVVSVFTACMLFCSLFYLFYALCYVLAL